MAALPNNLPETPASERVGDLLSEALRQIRITGSLQYCYMPSGAWITDATPGAYKPRDAIGFHIMTAGTCWLELEGVRTVLEAGDIAAFPFGTPHWIGAGDGGRLIDPGGDLPPAPWRETPILRYESEGPIVRILCGYIQCEAMNFRHFSQLLPTLIHVRTLQAGATDWLAATIKQIVAEVDHPQGGGRSVLERLTELAFLEVLRRQILAADASSTGWLAAIQDPALSRCLHFIHSDPGHDWSVEKLAAASGLSRSALCDRFAKLLQSSPMHYIRDWRLFLASVRLRSGSASIAEIALDAGYAAEAAFNRAFSRRYGKPPALWRKTSAA